MGLPVHRTATTSSSNCFVQVGDQLVLTPLLPRFRTRRSPTAVAYRRHPGAARGRGSKTAIALMNNFSLGRAQSLAVVADEVPRELFTAAFRDNAELDYLGALLRLHLGPRQSAGTCCWRSISSGATSAAESDLVTPRGEDGRGRGAPVGDLLLLDGRGRTGGRLLLPGAESGDPHRVRPPVRGRVRQRCSDTAAHPHRRADPERQRLREGPLQRPVHHAACTTTDPGARCT